MTGQATGLLDCRGRMIHAGDLVGLSGETCDGTTGPLPSGFIFDPTVDVHRVVFDEGLRWWRLEIEGADTEWNRKYIDHANGLLLTPQNVVIVER